MRRWSDYRKQTGIDSEGTSPSIATECPSVRENWRERAAIETRYLQKIEAGEFGGSLAVLKRIKRELKTEWNELLQGL